MTPKTLVRIAVAIVVIAAVLATAHIVVNGLNLVDVIRAIHGG